MVDDETPTPDAPPAPLNALIDEHVEQLFDVKKLSRVERVISNALQSAASTMIGVVLKLAAQIGAFLGKTILQAENQAQPEFNELARVAILDMFGVDVGGVDTSRGKGGNVAAADAIGDMMLKAFSGQARGAAGEGEQLAPSDAPAKAFLSAMAQLALEGWLEGWLVEALTVGQIETFGELDDTISHVLGLGRASAAVHGPIVRHMIVEPLEWKIQREHRPSLLSPSTVARQWYRGRWDWADVVEELARQGWSDERIDAILSETRRYISPEDVALLAHRFGTTNFVALDYLREMGYDGKDAELHLLAGDARILDAQEKQLAGAVVDAFVRGDIDQRSYLDLIGSLKLPAKDAAHYNRLADLRRTLNVRQLSDGEAQQAVKREIWPMSQYRAYLADQGYGPDDVTTKELLLAGEIDQAANAEKLKAAAAADRAQQKTLDDAARAKRIAEKAVADAQPAYAEVRRAFVRGIVDVDRLGAAIELAHPGIAGADKAAIVADAQRDRAINVEQQKAHDAAIAADGDKALPLATLEQSVVRGISTLTDYDRELARRGFGDDARRVMVALLTDRLADARDAAAAHAAAVTRAAAKGISIPEYERAVRLGLRTVDELAELLDQVGTPDVQKELVLDLLARELADDQVAANKRAELDAAAAARKINLPLRRRAVIKGIRSIEQYAADLAAAGVDDDTRSIELQLVTLEQDDAAAKDERAEQLAAERAAKEAAAASPRLTLAQVTHAVKLGLLQPADLRAMLVDDGYAPDDVEILVASTVADVPTLRQAARTERAAAGELKTKGIALSDLQNAVARGLTTLDDYAGELGARGYGVDDVALLRELLAEKVAIDLDGLRKKVDAAIAGVDGGPTRAEVETAIIGREADDATITAYLTRAGVAADVALVYVRLLHTFAPPAADRG